MKKFVILCLVLTGCIGEDVNPDPPDLQIMNILTSLKTNEAHQFRYSFSVAFEQEPDNITWTSSDPSILSINDLGSAVALTNTGFVTISASATLGAITATDQITLEVIEEGIRFGSLSSNSGFSMSGDFEMQVNNSNELEIRFGSEYQLDNGATGVYLYLNNTSNSLTGALEVAEVTTFSGAHTYTTPNVAVDDYSHVIFAVKNTSSIIGGAEVLDQKLVTELYGTVATTSSYTLAGDFTLNKIGDDLELSLASNYQASSNLPDLVVYLSNNPNSFANALIVSEVTIFSGAHSYDIPDTGILDYKYVLYFCREFNVKVGHGEITDSL